MALFGLLKYNWTESLAARLRAASLNRRLRKRLTPQEWMILGLRAEGLTISEISARMNRNRKAVEFHLARVGRKGDEALVRDLILAGREREAVLVFRWLINIGQARTRLEGMGIDMTALDRPDSTRPFQPS